MRAIPIIKKPNVIIIATICVFVIIEIIFLRPSSTEVSEDESTGMHTSIETLIQAQKEKDEVGYNIEGFHYAAVESEIKDWEMHAKQAVLYEKSQMVLAEDVKIRIFDPEGKITNIEGSKAYYKMGTKDLELEDNVKITFPDGFWIKTERARYSSSQQKVTSASPFYGEAPPQKDGLIYVWGTGFSAAKMSPEIHVLKKSRVQLKRIEDGEITEVRSDKARINRFTRVAYFAMDSQQRYVEANQGSLHVRSRNQTATYDSSQQVLNYLTATGDVLIEETDKKKAERGMKYATCQKAEFLTQQDKVLLSGFPSAYQEHDTLTGDLITVYRKKNLVEVTQANAYHEGQKE